MASQRPNPFGYATPLGDGLSSVFNAFLSAPTPEQRAQSALQIHGMQADAKRALAAADYDTSRTEGQGLQNDATRQLSTLDFNAPNAQGIVMQAGGPQGYGDLPSVFATHLARQPGVTLDQMDPMVYAKTGNAGNTMQGTRMADATTQRGQDVTASTARFGHQLDYNANIYGHDRDYQASTENNAADNVRAMLERGLIEKGLDSRSAADLAQKTLDRMLQESGSMDRTIADNANKLQVEGIQQGGEDRRFNVNTPAGATTTLSPNNPLGVTTIQGNPTTDTVKAGVANRFLEEGNSVNVPLDPRTPVGAAFDVAKPDSGGMSLSVGPDGTVQMTQGGQGVGLPASTISNNLAAQDSIGSYLRTSKELRSVAMTDPTLFGATGNVRRFLQSAAGQADMLLQMAGKSDPNATKTADTVFESVLTDLSMAGVQDPSLYDPNLTDIDKLSILTAYQAAAAIAGQEGRGLSNEDFQKFRTIVGDPTAWGSSQQAFVAGLNRLDRLAMAELNARRARLGMTPVDPNAQQPQQPQGGNAELQEAQTAIARGADRRAVAQRYKQRTGQDLR
jgi:hypothetical protein